MNITKKISLIGLLVVAGITQASEQPKNDLSDGVKYVRNMILSLGASITTYTLTGLSASSDMGFGTMLFPLLASFPTTNPNIPYNSVISLAKGAGFALLEAATPDKYYGLKLLAYAAVLQGEILLNKKYATKTQDQK